MIALKNMKTILAVMLLGLLMAGCNNSTEHAAEKTMEGTAPVIVEEVNNAQNAIDYTGTYKGILPCADCEGIETEITLNKDSTFVEKIKYQGGKGNKNTFEQRGTYISKAAGTIMLNGPEPWAYSVGVGSLTRLDIEGNKITGDLAERYVLKKVN